MISKTLKYEFNLAEITWRIKNNSSYKYNKFKTPNCMIRKAYEYNRLDLVDKLCQEDSTSYIYLLKRLIDIKCTNVFFKYFNKFNINWNENLNVLHYLMFSILKQNNYKLFKYFIDNFKIDLNNNQYISLICQYKGNEKIYNYFKEYVEIPVEFKSSSADQLYMLHLSSKINKDTVGEYYFKFLFNKKVEKQFQDLKKIFYKNI